MLVKKERRFEIISSDSILKDIEVIVYLVFICALAAVAYLVLSPFFGIYAIVPSLGLLVAGIHSGRKRL